MLVTDIPCSKDLLGFSISDYAKNRELLMNYNEVYVPVDRQLENIIRNKNKKTREYVYLWSSF